MPILLWVGRGALAVGSFFIPSLFAKSEPLTTDWKPSGWLGFEYYWNFYKKEVIAGGIIFFCIMYYFARKRK